jgi:three-Cys-motif partner protein
MPGEARGQLKKWARHKLESLGDYLEGHAAGLKSDTYYIDLFSHDAAAGVTPPALETEARFAGYIFVARDGGQAREIRRLTAAQGGKTSVITGSLVHDSVVKRLFDSIPRSASSFALIDPPGYRRLRWSLVKKLATHGVDWRGHKTDLLIIFPLEMALTRNLTRPECAASITRLFGGSDWLEIKKSLVAGSAGIDAVRHQLVALYSKGLKSLGYRYVSDASPAPFSRPPVYHVIWASDRQSRAKLLADVWGRPRYLAGELFAGEKAV